MKIVIAVCTLILVFGSAFLIIGGTTTWFGEDLHNWLNQPSEMTVCVPVNKYTAIC